MDAKTKTKISDFARDCTVGSGRDPEECDEPDLDSLAALMRFIGRPLTGAEIGHFASEWRRCVQEMEQP